MRILNGQCATLSTNNRMHHNTQSSDRGKRDTAANPSNQRDQLLGDVGRSSKVSINAKWLYILIEAL